ncbi:uncharacterized protein [Parasteatoda tepidariorum]|uniref:uncharacterized protein n=1 Tax=Parasteatoda tepidariorum TaxID=114398 RepID=UPI0039BC4734
MTLFLSSTVQCLCSFENWRRLRLFKADSRGLRTGRLLPYPIRRNVRRTVRSETFTVAPRLRSLALCHIVALLLRCTTLASLLSDRAFIIGSPFFPGKKLSKPHAEITEGTAEGTERIVEAKTAVPIEKEIRFYEAVDKIDPIVLKVLMGNATEGPRVPSTPSPHCCFNGGTCHVHTMNEADRWCSCPLNFTGRFCDVDVDECLEPEICDEHQVCINTYGSYRCDCRQGYVWDDYRCVGKTNCYKESCPNFGECVEKDDGRITCICPLGYTGEKCERKLLDCDDSSCTEEEICVATLNGYQCIKV